jgi:serine/threonine-protein kinase
VTGLGGAAASLRGALQGRYTIERELGRGGMATVHLARDLRHDRWVALKVLRTELRSALGPERFQREIHVAGRLAHPHILPLFESGEAAGNLWYTMPYVDGASLRQRLQREPQLPVGEAIRIATQVAEALDHAHQQGIVHRDIKPENILLEGERALVTDFGIARALDAAGGEKLTQTGLALGTPTYMSPEQAAASSRLDARSDIYALGCVTYEMLAGSPPFTGPTGQAILARHAVDPVPPLHTVRATVPEAVEEAIERALAKVPADRFATAGEFARALTAEQPSRRRRRRLLSRRSAAVLTAIGAIALVGLGSRTLRRPAAPAVLPSAASIAVLPFSAPSGDTALSRLGRDLAVTLSASLNGVGGIQTTDRLTVATETSDRGSFSTGQGAALARRLGAGSFTRGTLVRAGDQVRLDLGLYRTEGQAPLAEGIVVTGHRDSISALTDSVAWRLLRQVWQRGAPPSPSLAAVTTRSLPALRAFLDGEHYVEEDQWDAARLAYRSAVAGDSTFWLAYFRYALAQYWQLHDVEPEVSEVLYQHRNVFPERDRLLVEAWAVNDSQPVQMELLQAATQRFPDYWPAWFLLGDKLFHVGPFLGYDWGAAQSALNRAVALNPRLRPAWDHLFHNAAGKDTLESGRAAAGLRELDKYRAGGVADEPDYYLLLLDAVTRAGSITPQLSALADSVAKRRIRVPFLKLGLPTAQIQFNRRALLDEPDPAAAANLHRQIAWAWAQRGAWDSALVAFHRAVEVEPTPPAGSPPAVSAVDEYELAVLAAWLGVIDTATAGRLRPAAWAVLSGLRDGEATTEFPGQLVWFDGVLAFSERDRAALERARQSLRRSGHPHSDVLDRSLAAFGRALGGDRAGAGRELAALEWHCMSRWGTCGDFYPHSPNIAIHRLAAATWLLEAGDTSQASRLLTWHERGIVQEWEGSLTYGVAPLAYLTRARIEEAQRDTRSATEHYRLFLQSYDLPMPARRHLVDEARAALARLSGQDQPASERRSTMSRPEPKTFGRSSPSRLFSSRRSAWSL